MVGEATDTGGVDGAVDSVVVCPSDMSAVITVDVCCWPIAAAIAPRVRTPLTDIAAARHLSCGLRIVSPPFRSLSASRPSETDRSCDLYPRCLRVDYGAAGKRLQMEAHQCNPGWFSRGYRAGMRHERRAATDTRWAYWAIVRQACGLGVGPVVRR